MKKLLVLMLFVAISITARAQEQVIQGAFLNNGQVALCVLRYYDGKITHYAVSQDYAGNYNWQSIYPDNPHPTNSYQDSSMYRNYKYKISAGGTYIYFNLNSSSGGYGNSYGNSNSYGNNRSNTYGGGNEEIVSGVFIYNGQQNLIYLKFQGGRATHYATSTDYRNQPDWKINSRMDNAHPTDYSDGSMQRAYKYKVSVEGTTVYFNK